MSSGNDENELKKCLGEIIELIESTILEESSYSNEINSFNEKKQILDKLTHTINEKLKQMLQSSSDISKEYFLDLFSDYHYDFNQGKFNETIKAYIIQQLSNDLSAIRDSFDAFQAAFNGNLSIVKHFIENYPKYKDKSGIWGTTLLYSASRNNHIHIVKYLIEQGKCDVNKQNKKQLKINPTSGSTPLHAACYHGHLNIVKYLIDNGADYFIKNYANETPIHNGFSRDNIRLFFQQFLIFSYNNLTTNPPNSTIEHDNQLLFDSIWEFKSIQSDQWIQFDQNQSNLLQKSLIFQNNKNYNQLFAMEIEKQLFSISVVQFLSSNLTNNKFLWIRCRGSSIINFNFYSKWQIMFHKYSSQKDKKSPTLEVFNIDQDQNIKLNQWYYPTQIIDQQLNYAMNYRRKFTFIDLSFINNESFYFNLETFSFNNNDSTIQGFIRWIPQFIITNTQTIIDNFNISNNIDLIPNFRDNSHMQNSYAIDLPTTTSTSHFIDQETNDEVNDNVNIDVRFGDLIEETCDVIVVCWSSKYLLEMIYARGGPSIRSAVNNQLEKKLKNSLTSVKSDGDIKSKRIYFMYWETQTQTDIIQQSLQNLINISMQKAHDDNYRSIAFPAIGCGHYEQSIQLVAQTMVNKAHQEQILHKISVAFIIQPNKKDLFQHFQKQIDILNQSTSMDFVSSTIQNGLIQIEKGNITEQKVDVIVVSTASDYLRQIIIIEGGEEVYQFYEKETNSNPNSLLISSPPGKLLCKRIFFVKWKPVEDENILRQSLIDLIWNVIQNVLSYKFDSIAFPSIGCGHSNISQNIIIQTLIYELINQIKNRNLSLIIKFIILPDEHQIYQQFCEQLLQSEQSVEITNDDKIPSTWEFSTEKKYRFLVSNKSDEFKTIANQLYQSIKGKIKFIVKIERIQNERWYFQYLAHKKDFFKRLNQNTEKRLYHGCPHNAANSIIEDCFNRSFAGVNGTTYGVGVYFSTDANYSNQFSKPNSNGEKLMFVARVLIGKTTIGNPSMKTRPPGFDTTTDGSHIYVTYHDAQAYAEYLITFK